MAVPTLAIGLLPTYASIGIAAPLLLLLMRILQGVAIGGEVPGAWVFVAEHVPEQRFGFGIGTLTAGLTTGILFGSLMAGAINTIYSPADVAALRLADPVRRRRRVRLRLGLPAAFPRGDAGLPGDEGAPLARARGADQDRASRPPRGDAARPRAHLGADRPRIVVVILFTPTYLQQVFHVPAPLRAAGQQRARRSRSPSAACSSAGRAIASARARR